MSDHEQPSHGAGGETGTSGESGTGSGNEKGSGTGPRRATGVLRNRAVIAVPILIVAVSTAVMLVWLPSLPDRVVTQWSPTTGQPTSLSTASTAVLSYVVPALFTVLLAVLAVLLETRGSAFRRWAARFTAGTSWTITLFISAGTLVMLSGQRGLEDASLAAPPSGSAMAVGAVLAVMVGVGGAALLEPRG
ncbi:hypothetical protein [Lolliginicoccus levis]|uniref:hypothetical protein n=1 Tax=Lolliginicoccus levis TaxID=2919542 RepID=UPI00241F9A03|nr:hypothetical protein [Lolliginicoccus levis]